MYFELDGSFPNHPPNPIEPENIEELQERVVAEGADFGAAFDGDADRVFVVDRKSTRLNSSHANISYAVFCLKKKKKKKHDVFTLPIHLATMISSFVDA